MKRFLVVTAALGLATLVGCMEIEQTAAPAKQGKYQGKPDAEPWSSEPLAMGPKWKKDDRTSWEEQIRKRQLGQHEDRRIYQ
ncbi:MAG: hypothetical protein A3F77_05835 [Betaproteobacteria bacterium RIFCSPLOWO2_12_FULL_67_28]|nr:MAG: hypothetical protein A3F77_05835 [Betaproteobacteria bacterium RIFCSPLOWO2_12_FULL_67_28]